MKEREIDIELEELYKIDRSKGYALALEINKKSRTVNYPKGLAHSLKSLSAYYQSIGDYAKMLEATLEAIDIFKAIGDVKLEAHCLNDLGAVYNFIGDHETRLEVNLKCLELREEIGDSNAIIASLNNVGDTYLKLKDHNKAENSFLKGLSTEGITTRTECILNHNLGELYFTKEAYNVANSYFEQAIILAEQTDYLAIECGASKFFGKSLIRMGNSSEGYTYLIKACNLAKRNDLIEELSDSYKEISSYYENRHDNNNAFGYLKLHLELRNQLFEESKLNRINALLLQMKK
ncbi:MAG: tetratricopeptide repeat protein [Flavobacteriales bacterium]|nr:tetratricopeptide repeat protein [Flavobacteriales bacterium]